MNFLVVGLGSMGKRRIRCLKTLGYKENQIYGFDRREDRRQESETKYGIKTFEDFQHALKESKPHAMIISVPPDVHHVYMKEALRNNIHFFVEASVVDTDMEEIKSQAAKTKTVAAPSSTMIFHPAIKLIQKIVQSGKLGKISNVLYHSGQYLPDWHTYEKVSDFYVSNPLTGGAREIVPFELSWTTTVFGFPKRVAGNVRKTINILGAEKIDDTYNCLLDYGTFLFNLTIDVVSRCATRQLLINGDKAQLRWNWDLNHVKVYDPDKKQWDEIPYQMKAAEAGYHANIGENMYVDELEAFIKATEGKTKFIHDLENDHRVLKVLYGVEQADKTSQYIEL